MSPQEELEALRRKLAAREDRPGMAANVAELNGRIAELEAQLTA